MQDTVPLAANAQRSLDWLFQPVSIGSLDLPNRIAMAPMTRSHAPNGVVGPANAAYYRRRVEGGVGLIISEGIRIDHSGSGYSSKVPRLYGDDALAGWQTVVDAVHAGGGKFMPQLWHVGMERRPREENDPSYPDPEQPAVGPSGLPGSAGQPTVALSTAEIDQIVAAYASAAAAALQLGCDGIELHAAHGYLIDQFLRGATNQRDDAYGGDIGERTRFAVEVVRAVRAATGPDFPISFRFSQWRIGDYEAKLADSPAELEQVLTPIADAGVDIFHASTRRCWEPAFAGSDLGLAGWTKKLTGKTVITVGSVGVDKPFAGGSRDEVHVNGPANELTRQFENGEFDLVAVGRALLANPDWPHRVRNGESDFAAFTPEVRATLV